MSIISSVRAWLRECPLIDKHNRFNTGYLGNLSTEYSVSVAGVQHSCDITGMGIDEYNLVFQARLPYGVALQENLSAAELFDELRRWIMAQERAHKYPALPGYECTRITTANSGMITQAGADTAVYQLQIKLIAEESN